MNHRKNTEGTSHERSGRLRGVITGIRRAWRRATPRQRFTSKLVAILGLVIITGSLLLQNFGPLFQDDKYELTDEVLSLIGDVRTDTAEYLKDTPDQTAYTFELPAQNTEGATEHTGRVADAYSATFSRNPKQGIALTDKTSNIPVRLVPKFYTGEGKRVEDRIVYPFGSNQLIYSLKYDGLKEDIIIAGNKNPAKNKDSLDFSFELILPIGAEARLGQDGSIGIYTSDDETFQNITYGSDEDRALVEKAKDNADKTKLAMSIPAPVIKDASNQEHTDRSTFKLSDKTTREEKVDTDQDIPEEVKQQLQNKSTLNVYTLTIQSTNLRELPHPIAIDPTIRVPHAGNFYGVETDAGATIDTTNNLVRRSELTGGTVSSWNATTVMPANMLGFGAAAYNGYIYAVGGDRVAVGTYTSIVNYAPINSNGTIGSWSTTSSLTLGRRYHQVEVLNGYLYAIAGQSNTNTYEMSVEYAKINPDGTLGSWVATHSLPTGRLEFASTTHGGYLYAIGGWGSSGPVEREVYYARQNANGTVASDSGCGNAWCSGTTVPVARTQGSAEAYNGYVYLVGGTNSATVYYARINSDGSIGAWYTTSSMGSIRNAHSTYLHGGYLYAAGGTTTGTNYLNSVEYAPINANGSIGAWRTTTSFTTGSYSHGAAIYNGVLYVMGGYGTPGTRIDRVQYGIISSAGTLVEGNWSSATNLPAAYSFGVSAVYNGYLYHVGGWSGGAGYLNTVRYAPINADGSLGFWTTSGNTLATARREHAVTIYDGRMYVAGGDDGANSLDTIEYTTINANGSIGSFATTTSSMPEPKRQPGFGIYNGIAYIVGGLHTITNKVQRATVDPVTGNITGSWTTSTINTGNKGGGTLIIYGGYMYIVGGGGSGCSSGQLEATISYAQINNDGSLGTWQTGSSYVSPRCWHSAFLYNGYLYMLGGHDTTNPLGIEKAPVLSDGTVGTWQAIGSLDQNRGSPNQNYKFSGGAAHNGHVYLVGGYNGTNHLSSVVYKPLNNGGQGAPSTFTTGTTFTTARKQHASAVYDGRLYVLGGCTVGNCNTTTNTIRYATLNADGSIGSWSNATTGFTTARYTHYAFALGGRMYIAGGIDNSTSNTNLNDIQYATIQSNGNINTAWTTASTTTPGGHHSHAFTLKGNILYTAGGTSGSLTNVGYSTVNTGTGALSAWTTLTSLPEGRLRTGLTIYNGYLYVVGGYLGTGDYLRTVWRAPLNPDNTIGSWIPTTELNIPVSFRPGEGGAFALNGYLYAFGGQTTGNTAYNRTQYAAISADGSLGPWQVTSPEDFYHGSQVIHQGTLYITGGKYSVNDPSNVARYATLQSIPRIGTVSRYYDFEVGVRPGKLITRGTKQPGNTTTLVYGSNPACDASAFSNSQTTPDILLDSTGMQDITIGSNTLIRCLLITYTIDDQQAGVFPDINNQTHMTDFDLYYTANPGSRLRGGRTFTGGQDRGLDAPPQ